MRGCQGSLLVRVPDSWSKGCEVEYWLEQWVNFLFQNQLCVPTLIRCPFHPHVTAMACKRTWLFYQKCRWQVTQKHTYAFVWPNVVGVGWLCCCPGIVWEPIMKRAHAQLIREHSATVISARWATLDWSWPKEWKSGIGVHKLISTLKKKKAQTGNEWLNILPKSLQVRKKLSFQIITQHYAKK